MEFSVDPIFIAGDEYVLFLKYDLYGELFVVDYPQGRFKIIQDCETATITNQIDLYIQQSAEALNAKKNTNPIVADKFIAEVKMLVSDKIKLATN